MTAERDDLREQIEEALMAEGRCYLNESEGGHILDTPETCVECGLVDIPASAHVSRGQIQGGDLDGAHTMLVLRGAPIGTALCGAGVWRERDGTLWPELCKREIEGSGPCRSCGRGPDYDLHAPLLWSAHPYDPGNWWHADGDRHGHDAERRGTG